MSLIDNLKSLFRGRPTLPVAPKPPADAPRILLHDGNIRWDSFENIRKALRGASSVVINGYAIDLGGAVLDGSRITHPGDRNDENSRSIELSVNGITLRNGWVSDVPGGIVVRASNCNFRQLKFIRIGEDAISTVGTASTANCIYDCEFWNDTKGDKSIQWNNAQDATIKDCLVVGGITGIRIQKVSYGMRSVTAWLRGIQFVGCETGINAAGDTTVRLNGATFEGVGKKWVTNNGAKVVQT